VVVYRQAAFVGMFSCSQGRFKVSRNAQSSKFSPQSVLIFHQKRTAVRRPNSCIRGNCYRQRIQDFRRGRSFRGSGNGSHPVGQSAKPPQRVLAKSPPKVFKLHYTCTTTYCERKQNIIALYGDLFFAKRRKKVQWSEHNKLLDPPSTARRLGPHTAYTVTQ